MMLHNISVSETAYKKLVDGLLGHTQRNTLQIEVTFLAGEFVLGSLHILKEAGILAVES